MNELVDLQWAEDYILSSVPDSAEWMQADNDTKSRYLRASAFLITRAFSFRQGVLTDVPDAVKSAVCYQVCWMMKYPSRYPEALTKGILSASAGSLSVTFAKEFIAPLICEEAVVAIGELGELASGQNTAKTYALWW